MILPTLDQRLAARARGMAAPAMYQRWSDLLFLHWRWDAEELRRRLPAGLHLDTHDGEAWLGVVPFFMGGVRPRYLPAVPWLSWFMELNVRTYVHDDRGVPGVWFFSLECNQPLAVRVARKFFHLPYFDARMKAVRRSCGTIRYECRRHTAETAGGFDYQIHSAGQAAEPGTLEFFLVERYVLFAKSPRGVRAGYVHHTPYPLSAVEMGSFSAEPLAWNGFTLPGRPPDHVAASRGVDVRVGRLEVPTLHSTALP
jgi:uncharacterized protein YqjF (DUF2071 family)